MSTTARDLRLDFFRGLSLLFIFVDHIPDNLFSYFTLANFVFNDAAEIFVFISGYTATVVFGAVLMRSGASFAMLQVLQRCWTLYVAHIFLFVLFTAQVAYTAQKFENPMFFDEMKVAGFLQEPHVAIVKALTLQFQPEFMGILPLYIVLLLGFAFVLPLLRHAPAAVLAGSVMLYFAVPAFDINLTTYPGGRWFHNPFAWQILFVIGAICAADSGQLGFVRNKVLFRVCVAVLAASVGIKLLLMIDGRFDLLPDGFVQGIWLFLDKTELGPLRLLNFLALVIVVVNLVPPDARFLRWKAAHPVILCGQNSLYIFCLGILLSYLGHFVLVEINHSLFFQFLVSAGGIAVMMLAAAFLSWSKQQSRAVQKRPVPLGGGTVARQGGE
jgi:hypothetical protein